MLEDCRAVARRTDAQRAVGLRLDEARAAGTSPSRRSSRTGTGVGADRTAHGPRPRVALLHERHHGRPKGVMPSHANLVAMSLAYLAEVHRWRLWRVSPRGAAPASVGLYNRASRARRHQRGAGVGGVSTATRCGPRAGVSRHGDVRRADDGESLAGVQHRHGGSARRTRSDASCTAAWAGCTSPTSRTLAVAMGRGSRRSTNKASRR